MSLLGCHIHKLFQDCHTQLYEKEIQLLGNGDEDAFFLFSSFFI